MFVENMDEEKQAEFDAMLVGEPLEVARRQAQRGDDGSMLMAAFGMQGRR